MSDEPQRPPADEGGTFQVPRSPRFFWWDPSLPARWTVPVGSRVRIEAIDGWNGRLTSADVQVDDCPDGESNPCSGPIAIEGVQPGDTLVVEIEQMELLDPTGVSGLM